MFSKIIYCLKRASLFGVALMLMGAESSINQCGNTKILSNKSHGVEVVFNLCPTNDEISLGTVLNVAPGSRLWLKSFASSENASGYQMICQSRASKSLRIEVSSLSLPWISPDSTHICSEWDGRKLICDDTNGEKKVFFCASAPNIKPKNVKKPERTASELLQKGPEPTASELVRKKPERTTSVKLRRIPLLSLDEGDFNKIEVLKNLKTEARLCRELYGESQEIEVEWGVNVEGDVIDIASKKHNDGANPEFAGCILDVVKFHPYPKPSQTMYLLSIF